MKIKVGIKLAPEAIPPKYAHDDGSDSGMDLAANEAIIIQPGKMGLVRTGVFLEIPNGYGADIRPRSGLAFKQQISVLNTPGTIDAGYRGELGVMLINFGDQAFEVKPGDRIAQLVFLPIIQAELVPTDNLSDSDRGAAGFGSTGV